MLKIVQQELGHVKIAKQPYSFGNTVARLTKRHKAIIALPGKLLKHSCSHSSLRFE